MLTASHASHPVLYRPVTNRVTSGGWRHCQRRGQRTGGRSPDPAAPRLRTVEQLMRPTRFPRPGHQIRIGAGHSTRLSCACARWPPLRSPEGCRRASGAGPRRKRLSAAYAFLRSGQGRGLPVRAGHPRPGWAVRSARERRALERDLPERVLGAEVVHRYQATPLIAGCARWTACNRARDR
jgi:hypothetical protein